MVSHRIHNSDRDSWRHIESLENRARTHRLLWLCCKCLNLLTRRSLNIQLNYCISFCRSRPPWCMTNCMLSIHPCNHTVGETGVRKFCIPILRKFCTHSGRKDWFWTHHHKFHTNLGPQTCIVRIQQYYMTMLGCSTPLFRKWSLLQYLISSYI